MKKLYIAIFACVISLSQTFANERNHVDQQPSKEVVIIGGGIIGAFEAFYAHQDAMNHNQKIRVTLFEKGKSFEQLDDPTFRRASTNTSYNIVPSLTIDEILSVVPRGSELIENLSYRFDEQGGIRVDDVEGVNESTSALKFKNAVEVYGHDKEHLIRTDVLLGLGRRSMDLWQSIYDQGDEKLKAIFQESNFNPCFDAHAENQMRLHNGYRIDLLYDIPQVKAKAIGMLETYTKMGYKYCQLLTPQEVINLDPALKDFCIEHSESDEDGNLAWKNGSIAIWRPGGCIDTYKFLPKFFKYLAEQMGTYTDENGLEIPCFSLNFEKEVVGVEFGFEKDLRVTGLQFSDGTQFEDEEAEYVFCPGESVGTLDRLGFVEPTYCGFAGPSLHLNLPLEKDLWKDFQHINHCMEVHKVGIVLAWQVRFDTNQLIIGVGGTKAFYGDQAPTVDQAFARNRHLIQLNTINQVLPGVMSLACNRDTSNEVLTEEDLAELEKNNILFRWVGRRAVAYDGFPTIGNLYKDDQLVANARCTTHLGSGGVSFAPVCVLLSQSAKKHTNDLLTIKALKYADSRRVPFQNKKTGDIL